MRGYMLIMMGSILVAGLGFLSHSALQLARPAAPPGEIAVVDERPVALSAQFLLSNFSQEDADLTLLTVSEPPTASPIITSIEPVADGLSMDAVMQMLAQARPEAAIREIRVKRERGVTIYEVDFSDGYRIRLDAASGQMLTLDTIRSGSPQPPPHRRVQGMLSQGQPCWRLWQWRSSGCLQRRVERRQAGDPRWADGLQSEVRTWHRRLPRR
jgi:hypothetical protein